MKLSHDFDLDGFVCHDDFTEKQNRLFPLSEGYTFYLWRKKGTIKVSRQGRKSNRLSFERLTCFTPVLHPFQPCERRKLVRNIGNGSALRSFLSLFLLIYCRFQICGGIWAGKKIRLWKPTKLLTMSNPFHEQNPTKCKSRIPTELWSASLFLFPERLQNGFQKKKNKKKIHANWLIQLKVSEKDKTILWVLKPRYFSRDRENLTQINLRLAGKFTTS